MARDPLSCHLLGYAYANGFGVPRDKTQAHALYQTACDLGWAEACNAVAEMYLLGDGVQPNPALAAAAPSILSSSSWKPPQWSATDRPPPRKSCA